MLSWCQATGRAGGSATGGVTTTFLIRDRAAKGKGKPETTIGTSETFTYDDGKRLATYIGKANLRAPQGDVTGEKIELFLEKETNELQRAEAYGANGEVQVREGHRLATGSHMTYTAADDLYLMVGTPVEITLPVPDTATGQKLDDTKAGDVVNVTCAVKSTVHPQAGVPVVLTHCLRVVKIEPR